MRVFVVGGAVRDLLLGRPARERDFVFLGGEDEFRAAHPSARTAGQAFRVFLVDGVEYAPARGNDIHEDLAARDLTVNALALDREGRLYAHPRAVEDLQRRVLRPASDTAMADDPLRVLRAARFAAQLPEFVLHDDLAAAMRAAADQGLLRGVIPERAGTELRKALTGPRPGRFVLELDRAGCLEPWLAELAGAGDIPAGPSAFHDRSVLGHTAAVMDRLAGDPLAAYMGLCHDLGKAATDPGILPHHYGHERRGEAAARALGERLRLPARWIRAGAAAARLHMKAGNYPELRPGTRVDLLAELHAPGLCRRMFALARADHGEDHWPLARQDLERMLAVELPPQDRDQGPASGEKLRMLRAQALAETRRQGDSP